MGFEIAADWMKHHRLLLFINLLLILRLGLPKNII